MQVCTEWSVATRPANGDDVAKLSALPGSRFHRRYEPTCNDGVLYSSFLVGPKAEQCGWLKDKYGLSWQVVPTVMDEMLKDKDKRKLARVTEAFLKMKKFDIAKLKEAYGQEGRSAA